MTSIDQAIRKIRARAASHGTATQHSQAFADGLRCAANMIEAATWAEPEGRASVSDDLAAIRQAFADYRYTEGCACCQSVEGHDEASGRLAKLLDVPAYADGSGHDFHQFRTITTGAKP